MQTVCLSCLYAPCISVETHDNSLYASTLLWASTLGEQFVDLLFGGIKTQVTNLHADT
jgi:hypothetical protein